MLTIGEHILAGLCALHDAGIVHRDLKPANVLIADDLTRLHVRLADFGLVRAAFGADPTLTASASLVGTPAYMSPEQVHGEPATPATDVWAFGAIVYEMLMGRPLFEARTIMALGNQILTKPIEIEQDAIPTELRRVLQRCLRRDSQRDAGRFASAAPAREPYTNAVATVRARLADEALWETTYRADTEFAYRHYLSTSKRQTHAARAKQRLAQLQDEAAWQAVLTACDGSRDEALAALRDYLARDGLREHEADARARLKRIEQAIARELDEAAWQVALRACEGDRERSMAALREYLGRRGQCAHKADAQTRLRDIEHAEAKAAFEEAGARDTVRAWWRFIEQHADSPFAAQARERRKAAEQRAARRWRRLRALTFGTLLVVTAGALGLWFGLIVPEQQAHADRADFEAARAIASNESRDWPERFAALDRYLAGGKPYGDPRHRDECQQVRNEVAVAWDRADFEAARAIASDESRDWPERFAALDRYLSGGKPYGDPRHVTEARALREDVAGAWDRADFDAAKAPTDAADRLAALLTYLHGRRPYGAVRYRSGALELVEAVTALLADSLPADERAAVLALPADERAAAIAATRLEGFDLVRAETYTCGGQRHTMQVYRNQAFSRALGLRDGETDIACEFVLVPAGDFTMGSPANEAGRNSDEGQRTVTIANAFLLARTELTQQVWQGLRGSLPEFPSHFAGDRRPVEQVSWNDVDEWCRINGLRLPSEAEWEYACRAGTTSRFCFGDGDGRLGEYAWYDNDSGTQPVGEKKPNAFGLYDIHGNVWEWCQDWYGDYTDAPTDGSALESGGSVRVYRGGCWGNGAQYCRSANRSRSEPDLRYYYLGFRPASSLPQ